MLADFHRADDHQGRFSHQRDSGRRRGDARRARASR
jgi:hypothetical protein